MGHVERYGKAKGSIPVKLQVVLRTLVGYDTPAGKFRAKAAFVADAELKTALETATRWAGSYGPGVTKTPEVVTCDNEDIEFLRLVDIDERGEGGRAWKVLTPQRWYVDLREDVVLDCLRARTLVQSDQQDGGWIIRGPFRWVKYGTQMRLALIDSALYRELQSFVKATALPKIKDSALEVGGVYVSRHGTPLAFLGRARVGGKPRLVFSDFTAFTPGSPDNFKDIYKPGTGRTLQGDYDAGTCQQHGAGGLILTSHSLVEKIGTVELGHRKRFDYFRDGYYTTVKPDDIQWIVEP